MYVLKDVYNTGNLKLAFERLVTNPESTYKNYFRNIYNSYAYALDRNIRMLSKRVKSGYLPMESIRVYMPKSNGLHRMYTLLSIEDQVVYQAFGNIIAEALLSNKTVRKRYKRSTFGNLYTNSNNIHFYQDWKQSYSSFTNAIMSSYMFGKDYIGSFDLTACYDSIDHKMLTVFLKKRCNMDEPCINSLVRLLETWMTENGKELGAGIPQGPQASGIVSEVVLSEYDEYIETIKKTYDFDYYRYVDDIKVMAEDEETVKWVLFLLDKKSKELGLFPQATKVFVHKITDIEEEIKRISIPLFEDDLDDNEKSIEAAKTIKTLLKKDSVDQTAIRRYFRFVKQNAGSNKLAITIVEKNPNLVDAFAYYVKRYPRKIPPSISNFIYDCCKNKTKQYASGLLLEAALGNLTNKDKERFQTLARELIKKDKKTAYIVDCRFKTQLIMLLLNSNEEFKRALLIFVKRSNWWVQAAVLYQAEELGVINKIAKSFLSACLASECCDLALASVKATIFTDDNYKLPPIKEIAPVVQNTLIEAKVIRRKRYSNSQINKYLFELTGQKTNFQWKKKLGKEHDQIEKNIFEALAYWKADLTAFINLWDSIDDQLCECLLKQHVELGGYTPGKIGCIEKSSKLMAGVPLFHRMCVDIHEMRKQSYLSHAAIQRTNQYTGPIPNKKRKRIQKTIKDGIAEMVQYW